MIDADDDEQGAQDAPCLGLIRAALNAEGIASGKSYRASASHQPQGKLSDTFVVGLAEREESAQRSDSAAGALQDGKPQPGSDTAEMHHCVVSHGGSKAANHRSDTGITSRCGTPQPKEGVQASGISLASLTQGYAVPFPDSSTLGMSPKRLSTPLQRADSSRSEESNANPGDFRGTESPPWSPRRVPPAHLWGEGPPRYPGYRSGGAILPDVPEGVSATDLVQAALELQSLLVNRASFGLGPLLHAQPYFSASRHSCEDGLQLDVCGSQIAVPTSLLQASPIVGSPAAHGLHAAPAEGPLCAEGALLTPVAMQLPEGGTFPTPCMWELKGMEIKLPALASRDAELADEVTSGRAAAARSGNLSGPAGAHAPLSDLMGTTPPLPYKKPLEPKQAWGTAQGPHTPAQAEQDRTSGAKRLAEAAAEDDEVPPQPQQRKPQRATKRRLF